ncbi:unnamed protein product [Pleuronectes platessa]|uniref:Uncharacterized protein n=1 Tax=Pleuronectes platessa TaxID=8262 RepID=A0A9N7UXI0_PLEPL|nr:unnamed protein product [Pleuronectes platessa]
MNSHGLAPRLNPSKWCLPKLVSPLSNLFSHRCTHLSWSCVCGPHPVPTNEPEVPTSNLLRVCTKGKEIQVAINPRGQSDFLGTMQPAVQLITCANVKSF